MTTLLEQTLQHLRALVSYDTRNPPRAIDTQGIFDYVRSHLPGFSHETVDHGDGCVSLLATRGRADILYNVHLDTVPTTDQWTRDPFELVVTDDRAFGLGACDIKGAAACLLTAAESASGDLALLFTSDEEHGSSRCVREFLRAEHGFDRVIVAEPTTNRAVLAHRGLATATLRMSGVPGHGGTARALSDNAIHRIARWIARALDLADSHTQTTFENLDGIRLNVGRISGGVKNNIIAPEATVTFGIRPLPGQSVHLLMSELEALAPSHQVAEWQMNFEGPTLPSDIAFTDHGDPLEAARGFAESLGLPIGDAVDFWTEASFFSATGLTAIVFGPGSIDQAHTADEWVALDQLDDATETYLRVIDHGR